MSTKCPACGKDSDTSDFCSFCGSAMDAANADPTAIAAPAAAPVQPTASTGGDHCPKCNTKRDDPTSPFCGVCGYNFDTGLGGDVSVIAPTTPATTATPAAPTSPAPQVVPTPVQSGPRLDLEITVDGSVAGAPAARPPRTFSLFDEESVVGRIGTSANPNVPVEDKAVSKRHAMIVRHADGSYIVRDLQSANGTAVNGQAIVAGADAPIKEGDTIRIGEFSIITVVSIRQS